MLHHVADYANAVAELHRILAPEGRLIISDYDENETGFLRKLRREVRRQFANVTAYSRWPMGLVLVCEKSATRQQLPKGRSPTWERGLLSERQTPQKRA